MNKIYVISDSDELEFDMKHPANLEDVVDFAERSGKGYTTKGFLKAFNSGEVNSHTDTLFKIKSIKPAIEIGSSQGEFYIDKNGFVYDMDGKDYLLDIKRVDYDEYQEFLASLGWKKHEGDVEDILAFGFWTKDGKYTPAEESFRKGFFLNDRAITIRTDVLIVNNENLKIIKKRNGNYMDITCENREVGQILIKKTNEGKEYITINYEKIYL